MFWPASLKGLEWAGWRDTMVFFALLQLVVCLPLHLAFVPRGVSATAPAKAGPTKGASTLPGRSRRIAFVALASAFALNGFIVSVLTVHLINVLQRQGLTLETAVWIGSFFGPMQVAGRILEFSVGRRFTSRTIGMLALSLLVIAIGVLLALDGQVAVALLFALLFGFSNGVVTIVRGTVPAELFGRTGYGRTLGNLAAPALVARAIAPLAFAPLALPEYGAVWLAGCPAADVDSVSGKFCGGDRWSQILVGCRQPLRKRCLTSHAHRVRLSNVSAFAEAAWAFRCRVVPFSRPVSSQAYRFRSARSHRGQQACSSTAASRHPRTG